MGVRRYVVKTGLKGDEFFAAVDVDKDGETSEADFAAFCAKAAKEVEATCPDEQKLGRVFASLADTENGKISKEETLGLIKIYYKVLKQVVITSGLGIGDSEVVRKIDEGEIFVAEEEPTKEEGCELRRVQGKALKDGAAGYVSLEGNQGSIFLQEGGDIFKVVKKSIDVTDRLPFEDGVTVKKLKEGDLCRVLRWMEKEPESGAMRAKVKARNDGTVGWVTVSSADGNTTFLEAA